MSLRKPEGSQRRLWEDFFNQFHWRCLRDSQIIPLWNVSDTLYETFQRCIWDASIDASMPAGINYFWGILSWEHFSKTFTLELLVVISPNNEEKKGRSKAALERESKCLELKYCLRHAFSNLIFWIIYLMRLVVWEPFCTFWYIVT